MMTVLSIKPEYADAILDGAKRYEFRKAIPKRLAEAAPILLYATAPVKKVVGFIAVRRRSITGTPAEVWAQTREGAGITKEEFDRYFAGRKTANALVVQHYARYSAPRDLEAICPGATPPRSFGYIFTKGGRA